MHLLVEVVVEWLVFSAAAWSKTIAVIDEACTETMVKVGMCEQVCNEVQVVSSDVFLDSLILFFEECTAVNDDGFIGFVVNDIGILAEEIEGKELDGHRCK